jgi:hypothetical protein
LKLKSSATKTKSKVASKPSAKKSNKK